MLADRGYGHGPGLHHAARVCVLRKSQAAIARAQHKVKRKARKNRSRRPRPEALRQAQYVLVLSTFPPAAFTAAQVLQVYQAWLYGKRFLALLTEKLIAQARAVSPWGYDWPGQALSQPLA